MIDRLEGFALLVLGLGAGIVLPHPITTALWTEAARAFARAGDVGMVERLTSATKFGGGSRRGCGHRRICGWPKAEPLTTLPPSGDCVACRGEGAEPNRANSAPYGGGVRAAVRWGQGRTISRQKL